MENGPPKVLTWRGGRGAALAVGASCSLAGRAREMGGYAVPLTGDQFEIFHGDQRVTVTEVGATLRSFQVTGREILDTFGPNEMSEFSRGQALLPFPNRVEDGLYEFEGRRNQLPLNEPERNNAIHGLTRWLD